MFSGPVRPVEVFFYWPEAVFGNFYWPGAIGSPLASSPAPTTLLPPSLRGWLLRQGVGIRLLPSRVSGWLLDSLVHENYLILGKKTPEIKVYVFNKY